MPEAPQAFLEPPLSSDMAMVRSVVEELLDKQTCTLEGLFRESVGELAGGFDEQAESQTPSLRQQSKRVSSTDSMSAEPEFACSATWPSTAANGRNENGYRVASSSFQFANSAPKLNEAQDLAADKAVCSTSSLYSEEEPFDLGVSRLADPFAFARNCEVAESNRDGRARRLSTLREHIGSEYTESWSRFESCLEWWENLKEPPRHRRIDRIVRSATFEWACLIVICLNMILIAYATDYEMKNRSSLRYTWVMAVEFIFAACYVVEISLRLVSSGVFFFIGSNYAWNLFDLFLVVVTLFSQVAGTTATNWTVLRTLRLLRVAKVIRAVRLLHRLGLDELMLMLRCIMGSMSQLCWCVVLLAFISFLFGICFVQVLAGLMEDGSLSPREEDDIKTNFGSVYVTMMTLVQATTGGRDWGETYDLLGLGGMQLQMLFLFYIVFNIVSLWNVITSAFVEKALQLARPPADRVLEEQYAEERKAAATFRQLFESADEDGSGTISLQDLEVDINTLVGCCIRIKGLATSLDLHTVRHELWELRRIQNEMLRRVQGLRRRRHHTAGATSAATPRRATAT
ncbi:unnamed protein product, partial [Prorocentrum cordatum]